MFLKNVREIVRSQQLKNSKGDIDEALVDARTRNRELVSELKEIKGKYGV